MKLHHISSSMMLVNTYILMDEEAGEAALIDPGFSNPELFSYLETCPCKLKYLIATHGHGDHTALLGEVQRRFGGKVAIHEADAYFLTSDEAGAHAGRHLPALRPLPFHGGHAFS